MRTASLNHIAGPVWAVVLIAVMLSGCSRQQNSAGKDFVVFDGSRTCSILVSEQASEGEIRAAQLLQQTLAEAAQRPRNDFAVVRQAPANRPVITLRGLAESTGPKLEERVAYSVSPDRLEITAYPADAIEAAAAWFLERTVGARWFMPGALGEHVRWQGELCLAFGEVAHRPSYVSRSFSFGDSDGQLEWRRLNRLRGWFRNGHAMSSLFRPEDLRAKPELMPTVNGRRFIPATDHEGNWQPNIASEAAAVHAAEMLKQRPEFSSAIGMNDSLRYDQSEETRRLLGEPRWFRLRPDFSPLVFRFVNEVAKRVPDRYLGAYAYHWTEDTPPFPVEKNVVPFLTADRSEWFDPRFAEEDKALIRRWAAAGPEVVGLYDYYYGAPFLVPRPTLYAVAQSIPFAREAGARAFYAEVYPNWALDGPKAWLAAQLLWDAKASPEALLDTYYRDFWREAAGPMREFYALCDEQWLNQPRPSYWIKYYNDEHQYLLFPPAVRERLRGQLDRALDTATTELTRNRVRFVVAGFTVTEAFCAWNETRERLSRAALASKIDPMELRRLREEYGARLEELQRVHRELKRDQPLALNADLLREYTRNDPRRRAAWRLGEVAVGGASDATRPMGSEPEAKRKERSGEPTEKPETGDRRPETGGQTESRLAERRERSKSEDAAATLILGDELLVDPGLARLEVGPTAGFFDLEWGKRGPWRGHGEPYQTRRVSVVPFDPIPAGQRAKGEAQGAAPRIGLEMRGCKQETMSQFARGVPGRRYLARVKVRGKVSPGNMTFLILNFQDGNGRTLGLGTIDRLPVGEFGEAVELATWMEAPPETVLVGLGVRALNQIGDDQAVFAEFSLREVR